MRYLSVPMITVFKSLSTVATGFGDYFFFGQSMSHGVFLSLIIMVCEN